ncbi:MAG: hypothetical protein QXU67_05035, partial [Candidatus Bathyarchaeia archaeon]
MLRFLFILTVLIYMLFSATSNVTASDGVQIIVEDITYPETHTKMAYYVAEIGSLDPMPHALLAGPYNLLEHYAWLWGSAEYSFP